MIFGWPARVRLADCTAMPLSGQIHRQMLAALVLLSFAASPLVLPRELLAQEPAKKAASPGVALYEQERRLVLLPLENASADESLNYLSQGVIKILGGKVEAIGYARAASPGRLLFIAPAGPEATKEAGSQLRVGRFSRDPGSGETAPEELQRVILKTQVREMDEEVYQVIRLDGAHRIAAALNADYLVRGSYFYRSDSGVSKEFGITRRGPITIRLQLYNAVNGTRRTVEFSAPIQQVYRELDEPAEAIRSFVAGERTAPVAVETAQPGAMVYLDNLYLGRTPLQGRALPGSYTLRIDREGFQSFRREVAIDASQTNSFRVRLAKSDHRARLKLTSNPDGAEVYLNLERIGTTPLDRGDLPPGAHRLRIAKEGHIDRFIGVELSNDEPVELTAKLEPGDTETHFKNPNYVIFDLDHFDTAFYSFMGALGFYGGFIYFNVRADRTQDRLRARLPLLSLTDLPTLLSESGAVGVLYYAQEIERNNRLVNVSRRNANISGGLAALSLLTAGWFVYRGLSIDTAKESGELSWFLRDALSGGDPGGNKTLGARPDLLTAGDPSSAGIQNQAELRAEPYYEAGLSLSF